MSEWTSLSCKEQTKDRLKDLQEENESQDGALNRALDALESNGRPDEIDKLIAQQLEQWEHERQMREVRDFEMDEFRQELTETQELIKDLDVMSGNERVLKRIKDMETELKSHFERELRK